MHPLIIITPIVIAVILVIAFFVITNESGTTHYITLGTDYIEGDALPGGDTDDLRPIGLGYIMESHIKENNRTGEQTDITDTYYKEASIPGPIIKIKQYDTIILTIQNGLDDGCVSVHVHGLEMDINNDGTLKSLNGVNDQCATKKDSYQYSWFAGIDSVGSWPYHDHTYCNYLLQEDAGVSCEVFRGITGAEEIGLYGAIIVEDDQYSDVKMDYLLYMSDSAQFHGIQLNHTSQIQTHLGINPDITANENDKVRFTIIGVGSAFHTFHLHAQKWLDPGTTNWIDTKVIGPMTVHQFEIYAGGFQSGKGDWQYHCHVFDHLVEGMSGSFKVT